MSLASLAAVGRALAASLALFVKLAAADSRFAGHRSYGYYTALVLEYHYKTGGIYGNNDSNFSHRGYLCAERH